MKKFALLFAVLGAGCVVQPPRDIRFESVDVLDYKTVPYTFFHLEKYTPLNTDRIKILQIHVSSTTDLIRFAKEHSVNVVRAVYLCDGQRTEVLASNYISAGKIVLSNAMYSKEQGLDSARAADGRISYQLYVPLNDEVIAALYAPRVAGAKSELIYDVQRNATDLCVGFRGGGMQGTSFASNLTSVPREKILAALKGSN